MPETTFRYPVQSEPPVAGSEIDSLLGGLDRQRRTLFWKCADLDAAGMRATVGASVLTLGGLLRHLALVEDEYFGVRLAGRERHAAFTRFSGPQEAVRWVWAGGDETPEETVALWRGIVAQSRTDLEGFLGQHGLDGAAGPHHEGWGTPSLRRVLVDLLEEYARHTGHADLIREAVDGRVGEDPPSDFPAA